MTTYYPQLLASKLLSDADRSSLAADDADKINFIKGKFILAIQIGYNGKDTAASAYKLQWRNVTDSGAFDGSVPGKGGDVAATGECKYSATSAVLADGTAITGPTGGSNTAKITAASGQTWQQLGQENVADNLMPDSSTLDLGSDSYTEMQWALDLTDALDGKQYEWRLWNNTSGATVGTCAAQITTMSVITGTITATLAAVTGAAAGGPLVTGTVAATVGATTASAAGEPLASGTMAATLAAITAAAEGNVSDVSDITGTADAILSPLTASAAGSPIVTGTAIATCGQITSTVAGTLPITGEASAMVSPLTALAAGEPLITGTALANLTSLFAALAGGPLVTGTVTATLSPLVAVASNDVISIIGTIAATLAALIANVEGESIVDGTIETILGATTATASGMVQGWAIIDSEALMTWESLIAEDDIGNWTAITYPEEIAWNLIIEE